MAARGTVRYVVQADTNNFQRGISEAEKAFNKFSSNLTSQAGGVGAALSSLGPAGIGAAAAIGGVGLALASMAKFTADAVSKAADYADILDAMAAKTGLSADALQSLMVAAKLGNSSLEAVTNAVNKMQRGLIEGSSAFKRLGLNISDLKKLNTASQFETVAKAISGLGSDADKAAARMAVFGKGGNEIAGTLKAMADGAGDLGGALSGPMAKAAADFRDKSDLLGIAWQRVIVQFGAAVAKSPELQKLFTDLTTVVAKVADWIGRHADHISEFIDRLVGYAKTAAWVMSHLPGGGALADTVAGLASPNYVTAHAELASPRGGRSFVGGADAEAQKKAYAEMLANLHTHFKNVDDATEKESKDALARFKESEKERLQIRKQTADDEIDEIEKRWKAQQQAIEDEQLAWKNLFTYLDQMDQEDEDARQKRIDHWSDLADVFTTANQTLQLFGVTAESALGKLAQGLEDGMRAAQAYAAAQNDMQRSMSILGAAQSAYSSGSVLSGAATGASIGTAIAPGIGTAIGAAAGGLLGFLGGMDKEIKKVNDMRDAFFEAEGGFEALAKKLYETGQQDLVRKIFDAKTVQDFEAAVKAAQDALNMQDAAQRRLNEAMERYGISIEDMGAKFAQQKLDEQALQLWADWELFNAAMADSGAILTKMAPSMQEYIDTALKAGATIPENLRPIIQQMIDLGLLTDASGEAFTSLEDAGLNFGAAVEDSMKAAADAVMELVKVIRQLYGLPPIDIPVNVPGLPSGTDLDRAGHGGEGMQEFIMGGRVDADPRHSVPGTDGGVAVVAHPGELFVPPGEEAAFAEAYGGGSRRGGAAVAIERLTAAIERQGPPVNVHPMVQVDASTMPAAHRQQFIEGVGDEVARGFRPGGRNWRDLLRAVRSANAQG